MISFILKLIELPGTWYNRHQVRKNATFIGKAQILRHAHIRPFRGSTAKDIIIGNDFRFFSGTICSQNQGKITIGEHCKIGFDCKILCANSICIGNYVNLADNITVCDNNNHSVNPQDRALMYQTPWDSEYRGWKYSQSAPIIIENCVWIGSNVRICKGVTIGQGAVTNDVEEIVQLCQKGGVATSGDYRNFYIKDGKKYAHTINPANGYPAGQNILSATIVAEDCMTADAYATTFMVLGVEKAKLLAQSIPQIEYFIIYADNNGQQKVTYSKGMLEYLPNRKTLAILENP